MESQSLLTVPWAAQLTHCCLARGTGSNNILKMVVLNLLSFSPLNNRHSKSFVPTLGVWFEAHPQGRSLDWPRCDHSPPRFNGALTGITNVAWEHQGRFAGTRVPEGRVEE